MAIYIGNGKTVEARGVNNPKGGEYRTGDQGGEEIDCYSVPMGGAGREVGHRYTAQNIEAPQTFGGVYFRM